MRSHRARERTSLASVGSWVARLALWFTLSTALTGCPRRGGDERRPAEPRPCTKFGDSCEFSPGKLGSCMTRENCTSGNCLFCQSQH